MKDLIIQLQSSNEIANTKELIEGCLQSWDVNWKMDDSPEIQEFMNYRIQSSDLVGILNKIKKELLISEQIRNSTIIVCEGEYGWDDYLLLHHYDKSEKLDSLPKH